MRPNKLLVKEHLFQVDQSRPNKLLVKVLEQVGKNTLVKEEEQNSQHDNKIIKQVPTNFYFSFLFKQRQKNYLSTKMEITKQNGSLWTRDQQDDVDNEEETKHVVDLMRPE